MNSNYTVPTKPGIKGHRNPLKRNVLLVVGFLVATAIIHSIADHIRPNEEQIADNLAKPVEIDRTLNNPGIFRTIKWFTEPHIAKNVRHTIEWDENPTIVFDEDGHQITPKNYIFIGKFRVQNAFGGELQYECLARLAVRHKGFQSSYEPVIIALNGDAIYKHPEIEEKERRQWLEEQTIKAAKVAQETAILNAQLNAYKEHKKAMEYKRIGLPYP